QSLSPDRPRFPDAYTDRSDELPAAVSQRRGQEWRKRHMDVPRPRVRTRTSAQAVRHSCPWRCDPTEATPARSLHAIKSRRQRPAASAKNPMQQNPPRVETRNAARYGRFPATELPPPPVGSREPPPSSRSDGAGAGIGGGSPRQRRVARWKNRLLGTRSTL